MVESIWRASEALTCQDPPSPQTFCRVHIGVVLSHSKRIFRLLKLVVAPPASIQFSEYKGKTRSTLLKGRFAQLCVFVDIVNFHTTEFEVLRAS